MHDSMNGVIESKTNGWMMDAKRNNRQKLCK